jgi:hypothetical protein
VRVSKLTRRTVSGALVVALAGGTAWFSEIAANAAPPPPTVGPLTLTPATGTDQTVLMGTTSAGCPTTNDSFGNPNDSYLVLANGPGLTDAPIVSTTGVGFTTASPISTPFSLSMKDFTATQNAPAPAAGVEYDFTFACVAAFDQEPNGTFTGAIVFDTPTSYHVLTSEGPTPTPLPGTPTPLPPTPTPTPLPGTPTPLPPTPTPTPLPGTPTPTPVPGAKKTSTKLVVPIVRVPHFVCVFLGAAFNTMVPDGDCSVLIGKVAPPDATGTVQFKDKTITLGEPVQVRLGGLAVLITDKLGRGEHSLTAMFIPTDPAAFKPSTSKTVRVRVWND